MTIEPTSSEGRVMVALDDGPLEWAPTWTCLDYTPNLVSGFDLSRGRQAETETTDAATARVYLNDTDGLFDPANTGSPFFGKLDGAQIVLQCWDPVEEEWVRQFRGRIRRPTYDFNPATSGGVSILSNVQLECIDLFGYLARVKMVVGVFGDTPPSGSEGAVYYGAAPVDDRIAALLIEAGLSSDWYVVFTGNVDVQAMLYDASDAILTAIRDACDAEFPGIANCYTDRFGRFVFHGRFARFDPDGVSASAGDAAWDFRRWPAGDGAAILLDSARAQIRPPLQWTRASEDPELVNSAYCTPRGIAESAKAGQIVEDAVSIGKYGWCPWQAEGLIIASGTTTGNTAAEECAKFAEHFVTNRAEPRTRVSALTVKSLDPSDDRAAATWGLLLRADIADIIELEHGYPGGVGIAEDLYLEGIEKTVLVLNRDFDMVEATFAVSPKDAVNVFSNDQIANAYTISGTSGTVSGSNVGATTEDADELAQYTSFNPSATDVPSVWYRWRNQTGSSKTLTVSALTGSAGFSPNGPEVDIYTYTGVGTPAFADLVNRGYIGSADFGGTPTSDDGTVTDGGWVYLAVVNYDYADAFEGTFSFHWSVA